MKILEPGVVQLGFGEKLPSRWKQDSKNPNIYRLEFPICLFRGSIDKKKSCGKLYSLKICLVDGSTVSPKKCGDCLNAN
jgi:hypothetical protein